MRATHLTQDQVMGLLEPYVPDISMCIFEAWDRWRLDEAHRFPQVTDRGFANIMYEIIFENVTTTFAKYDDAEVFVAVRHDSVKLNFEGRLIGRFKKFRPGKQTSNYPTAESQLFDSQMYLPDIGGIDRVTFGYLPNELRTDIEAFVTYTVGKSVQWESQLPQVRRIEELRVSPSVLTGQGKVLPFRPKTDKEETGNAENR